MVVPTTLRHTSKQMINLAKECMLPVEIPRWLNANSEEELRAIAVLRSCICHAKKTTAIEAKTLVKFILSVRHKSNHGLP